MDGTIWTMGIIAVASFCTVLLFTNSLRTTCCVVVNILVILAVVLAIFYIDGMALGVVEAVAISVFLGTSTDYSRERHEHSVCSRIETNFASRDTPNPP